MDENELRDDEALAERLDALESSPEDEGTAPAEVGRDTSEADDVEEDELVSAAKAKAAAEKEDEPEAELPEEFSTLDQVAKAFQVEPAEFLKTIQIAGPDGTLVPLADVVTHFNRDAAARELPAQLQRQRVEFEQRETQRKAEHDRAITELATALGENLKHLKASENVDWDRLREEDPLTFSIKRTEFLEQKQAAQDAIRRLEADRERRAQGLEQERAAWFQAERAKLFAARPEWADPEALQGVIGTVANYLTTQGFDQDDPDVVRLIVDHRVLQLVHKAAQYDATQKKGAATLKRVVSLPKLVKPEARGEERGARVSKVNEARTRLRKSGSVEALADALGAMEA